MKYFSLLPDDAKPPIRLHEEVMEKCRPEMAKHYLTVSPRFD